jgi:hypothetical protein
METWRTLPPEELAQLARALAALRWSWSVGEVDQVMADLGWTVAAGPGRGGLIARTGYPPGQGLAEIGFGFDSDTVTKVSVPLTDGTSDLGEPATDYRRDAFFVAAGVLGDELGAPAERLPGPTPEIRWDVPDGVIRLWDSGVFVWLSLLSAAYAKALAAYADPPDGAELDGDDEPEENDEPEGNDE